MAMKAYVPEDELKAAKIDEEHLQDDGLSLDGQDAEYLCNEEDDGHEQLSYQNSPLSNGTNPDAGYASPLSDTSDHLADFKSTSSREGQDKEEVEDMESDTGLSLQDSLAQMKAVYANLISDASWSSITKDIMKGKQVSASTTNSTPSSHKGNNSTANSHASSMTSSGASSSSNASASLKTNVTPSSNSTKATALNNASNGPINGANSGGVAYDWHQAALAKTLQHMPYHLMPEPSLFSTVQLYRQNNKLYGPVFTGASKFRCHYRDDNKDKEEEKEPMPALASKLMPSTKKRAFQDLMSPCSPESISSTPGIPLAETAPTKDQKISNPYVTANNRYGYQNAHMMVTGHFLKVTNSASKKVHPSAMDERKESEEEKVEEPEEKKIKQEKEDPAEKVEKIEKPSHYKYLREEDLEESPKGGLDILNIHAAYQFQGTLIHSPSSPSPPPNHKSNVLAMEELVEKVTGKIHSKKDRDEKSTERGSKHLTAELPSPVLKDRKDLPRPDDLSKPTKNGTVDKDLEHVPVREGEYKESHADNPLKNGTDVLKTQASKTVSPLLDPLAMLYKISNNMMEKPMYNPAQVKQVEPINRYYDNEDDQPMDLTKAKSGNGPTNNCSFTVISNNNSNITNSTRPILSTLTESVSSPLRENALMDISDMKRKGRQSNWNPQHLLILQAQFASSLRETPDGKYIITDLGPQERVHICGTKTFVSKHAVKLHLSKTHGKSPEDHLIFVTELEKLEKA
ncbi:hypothetical protein cypCar_00043199 [Cyprinus carpio]|nr:hypothetical protein cypCar_00043199 [Cyprinus carpio]